MTREKLLEKIKKLNSKRAKCKRDFKEMKIKHNHHEISDKEFEKHKLSFRENYEKVRHEIQELEHQLNNQ